MWSELVPDPPPKRTVLFDATTNDIVAKSRSCKTGHLPLFVTIGLYRLQHNVLRP
ncbi:MAG: hypothetical protein ACJASB_000385 [Shewanella psychromarinicola]|jgi:hypothetical protein